MVHESSEMYVDGCVYGNDRFLEFIHEGQFVTVEVWPSEGDPLSRFAVEALRSGAVQKFERVRHSPTERTCRVPVVLATQILAVCAVEQAFAELTKSFSETSAHIEFFRLLVSAFIRRIFSVKGT